MNKRQYKKRLKKLNASRYVIITPSKRDRGHRIPKQKAVIATMGIGKSGVLNRNNRFYPHDAIMEAIRQMNFDSIDRDNMQIPPSSPFTKMDMGELIDKTLPTFSIRGM